MRKLIVVATTSAAVALGATLIPSPANAATDRTPVIKRFAANPGTFFPTIRDGYRDGVWFHGSAKTLFRSEANQSWDITIRNSKGHEVAERSGRRPEWNGVGWNWDGKNQHTGESVKVGTYRATLTVTNDETGQTGTSRLTLHARSDSVNQRLTKTRIGRDFSSSSRRGCDIDRDFYDDSVTLDCWGGAFAQVSYRFRLPSTARSIDWAVRGSNGCCDDGRVIRSGKRVSKRAFVITVRATDWRAYTVNHASVTYTTTIRR